MGCTADVGQTFNSSATLTHMQARPRPGPHTAHGHAAALGGRSLRPLHRGLLWRAVLPGYQGCKGLTPPALLLVAVENEFGCWLMLYSIPLLPTLSTLFLEAGAVTPPHTKS